jgi:1,4-alpha-glucan branching enzyme
MFPEGSMANSLIQENDLHLLSQGKLFRSYETLGAHLAEVDGRRGVRFAVWAPNASSVSVMGDWNGWNPDSNPMSVHSDSGVWSCFVVGIEAGAHYKYSLRSNYANRVFDKADPYAFAAELVPQTASRVWDLSGFAWSDQEWVENRLTRQSLDAPLAIYEVHLGSWMRVAEEENRWLTYREIAPKLVKHMLEMGFTHVEFLPLNEHPFYGSWGYQTVAYYAPTGRYGTPQDLMFLIDTLHQAGIGVILDWVPAHFPSDGHGLVYFDGTHLYEHADPRKGIQPDWGTYVFNYGRPEVSNFLISNALFWIDKYHMDGLRLDAVASMLYLDYSRKAGQWVSNKYGGRENLEAIDFVRELNDQVHTEYPGVLTIAEESTSWPMVSRPSHLGGLGFSMKWNMGWMHDVLDYIEKDPIHRSYQHNKLTFGIMYAYSENFILPFSHDEVVHLKKSMLSKMPGDAWRMFANLRLLYGFMIGHPGKKLLFMGSEFGEWKEWNHDSSLDWSLPESEQHRGLQHWFRDLLSAYHAQPALYEYDNVPEGFEWIDCNDQERSVISFIRRGKDQRDAVVFVCNFTPVPRRNYCIGIPWGGLWTEILNSDAAEYGGSGMGNMGGVQAEDTPCHGRSYSLSLTMPPLAVVVFRNTEKGPLPEPPTEETPGQPEEI